MIIIPLDTSAFYTESVILEEVSYDFTFQYNNEEAAWYLDLGLTGQSPVITSLKLTTRSNVLEIFSYMTDIPSGRLFLFDLEVGIGRVTREGLNDDGRFTVAYFTEAEYAALQ